MVGQAIATHGVMEWPCDTRTSMLRATQESRVSSRLLAGSRISAGVVIPAFLMVSGCPTVAALVVTLVIRSL
jgi:hypothetical protein